MGWIEDSYGKVLMVKQARGRKLWTLPGGKVNARESLTAAVVREIREETGLKVSTAVACDYYDRPKKGSLAVLFRVTLHEGKVLARNADEIESVAFRAAPPKNSTPSLQYFWARQRPL